jgi:molecular chaperone GrpE
MSEKELKSESNPDLTESPSQDSEQDSAAEETLPQNEGSQEASIEEGTESLKEAEVIEEEPLPTLEEVQTQLMEKVAEVERLKSALIAGDKDIKELQSRLRTVSAAYKKEKEDQEDFKQRIQRQMEYRESRRRGDVVKVLFEPLENLRRSHGILTKEDPESAVGIGMVIKAFMAGFTQLGLEEISPDGQKFDPTAHNALMAQPTPDRALDDVVLQTYAVGYRIEGLVLQPAQVIVGKYDGPPLEVVTEQQSEEEESTEGTDVEEKVQTIDIESEDVGKSEKSEDTTEQ